MKKHLFTICFSAALIVFSAYFALDTFVISKSYSSAVEMNTAMFAEVSSDASSEQSSSSAIQAAEQTAQQQSVTLGRRLGSGHVGGTALRHSAPSYRSSSANTRSSSTNSSSSAAVTSSIDNTSYQNENVSITVNTYRVNDTTVYVADVTLSSAQYLKTAFANNTYGKNVTATTSAIAQANNAILAINGDYYGVQEKGYVIRNGVVYRNTAKGVDVLCIYADGTMEVVSDREYSAEELVAKGVWQAFSFGPALVENSSVTVGVNTEVGKAMASNPRTAIGLIDKNHFVLVVSDGRTSESTGLSVYQLATFMQSLGVKTAYNLDGGGSSTMVFNGQLVNKPTTTGRISERGVSDIVYI